MKQRYKSEGFAAIHEVAEDLLDAGMIDEETLSRLDAFLDSLPHSGSPSLEEWRQGTLRRASLTAGARGVLETTEAPPANTIVFIDIEATGLHEGSVPTEIGLSRLNLETLEIASWGQLVRSSFLCDPDWDLSAMDVAGISPWLIEDEGRPAAEVVRAMGAWLGDERVLLSDAPQLDARWLNLLLSAAVAEGGETLELQVAQVARLRRLLPGPVVKSVPGILRYCFRPHRAEGDAAGFAWAVAEAIRRASKGA